MTLALDANDGIVFTGGSELELAVTKPDTMTMTPQDLGDGFSTFQLTFGDKYEGNIFTGEDLIANSVGDKGFMTLQVKGDEAYSNGVKKFLGVDTLKTTINNQEDVFGAGFALDSIREVLRPMSFASTLSLLSICRMILLQCLLQELLILMII